MYSERFQRRIDVTRHARQRMQYADRDDSLLCVAALLIAEAVVVKTLMHRFQLS
jgi:hypothetical protein